MFAYAGVVKSMVWLGKGGMGMAIVGGGEHMVKEESLSGSGLPIPPSSF